MFLWHERVIGTNQYFIIFALISNILFMKYGTPTVHTTLNRNHVNNFENYVVLRAILLTYL